MRIIRPVTVTDAMLISSNVAEDDHLAWDIATLYTVGQMVVSDHIIYECLVEHTGASPAENSGGTAPKWLNLGATNRWRMFDEKVGSQTTKAESITLSISPGIVDSIAFLDLVATEIVITMTDPTEGLVYAETIDLVSGATIGDGYTYFFEPLITTDAAVLLGIPPYGSAEINIAINYPSGTAAVGTVAFGMQKDLGVTQSNPSIGIIDYSKKEVDTFGNFSVLRRAYSKRLECELFVSNNAIDDLHRTLSDHRATPVIWVGADSGHSSMIIYGFYRSFSINVPYPNHSTCSLEIEGLS